MHYLVSEATPYHHVCAGIRPLVVGLCPFTLLISFPYPSRPSALPLAALVVLAVTRGITGVGGLLRRWCAGA